MRNHMQEFFPIMSPSIDVQELTPRQELIDKYGVDKSELHMPANAAAWDNARACADMHTSSRQRDLPTFAG